MTPSKNAVPDASPLRRLPACVGVAVAPTRCAADSTTGGNNSSADGGKAAINLTVPGAIAGSTTQLVKYDCAGASFGSFIVTLNPILNGRKYILGLLMGNVLKTPATRDLASPGHKVLLEINDDKTGTGGRRNNDASTATVTVDAGGDSGSVDAHNLDNGLPGIYKTKFDPELTFICLAKK